MNAVSGQQPYRVLQGSDRPELRFGFRYTHLQALAWRAMSKHAGSSGMDISDRFEAAWGAVVECLYSAPDSEPVTALDLYRAGMRGLGRLRYDDLKERGFAHQGPNRDVMAGPFSAPSVWRYWHQPPPPTPEDLATDRVALIQIMGTLTPQQARTLITLARHGGDHEAAATALGVTGHLFAQRLTRARLAFLAAWHEHEAVPRRWRKEEGRPGRRASAMRSQPASPADAARTLTDIREAFGDETRVIGSALLPRLAEADPGRYGEWDARDVGWFLREHGISRHGVSFVIDGQWATRWGYRLEDVTATLDELTAVASAEEQAA